MSFRPRAGTDRSHGPRSRSHLIGLVVACGLALAACTSSGTATPTVTDAWVRSNPNGMGAAYFSITMPSDDRLISAAVDPSIAARIEVHEVIEDAGLMRMREVDGGIALPAGESVEFRPGGYHLMLLDMPAMLEVGSTVTLTLRFATSAQLVIEAEVREGMDAEGMPEHSSHHGVHGGMHGGMHEGTHEGTHHGSHHGTG